MTFVKRRPDELHIALDFLENKRLLWELIEFECWQEISTTVKIKRSGKTSLCSHLEKRVRSFVEILCLPYCNLCENYTSMPMRKHIT